MSSDKKKPRMYLHKTASGEQAPVKRAYEADFRPSEAYRESLPDLMQAVDSLQGAVAPIQQVGISNFKLPLKVLTSSGESVSLEAKVMGTVSLDAALKGINMSRIIRVFYEHKDKVFSVDTLGDVLEDIRSKVGSSDARLRVSFNYPIAQESLRSGLSGYQYYQAAFEGRLGSEGVFEKYVHFDYVYSSSCPCSAELSEHAMETRDAYSIPHSQRSKARLLVKLADGAPLSIEDLQAMCLRALKTETQVMVKREDEQAFAELNGVYIKFVEDAARLLYAELDKDARVVDFQIACSHLESLHSHDAVSVICKGVAGGLKADFCDFNDLVC